MVRLYIDFDSTLYDTDRMKDFYVKMAPIVSKYLKISKDEALNKIKQIVKNSSKEKTFDICYEIETVLGLESGLMRKVVEDILADGDAYIFSDSIPFLKRMSQKGYEINILTYTNKEYEYQMLKIMGSKIAGFVDNIIFCSRQKGDLGLDYESAYFIDDNPRQLENLFNANVSEDRLIRIRRPEAGYSKQEIKGFKPVEVKTFDEIDI